MILATKIEKIEGVKAVAPMLAQTEAGGGFTMIWGIDPPSFEAMSGGLRLHGWKDVLGVRTKSLWMTGIAGDKHLKCRKPLAGLEPSL